MVIFFHFFFNCRFLDLPQADSIDDSSVKQNKNNKPTPCCPWVCHWLPFLFHHDWISGLRKFWAWKSKLKLMIKQAGRVHHDVLLTSTTSCSSTPGIVIISAERQPGQMSLLDLYHGLRLFLTSMSYLRSFEIFAEVPKYVLTADRPWVLWQVCHDQFILFVKVP